MPSIIKKCFLYHYNSSINSDKVFNLFLVNNDDGTFSAISEHGRSETKLRVVPLAKNCSLSLAQSRYSEKRFEKVNHRRTPYIETFNCSYSPTVRKYGVITVSKTLPYQPPAKVIEFKSATPEKIAIPPVKEQSGEQTAQETQEPPKRVRGALNLNRLDALEL